MDKLCCYDLPLGPDRPMAQLVLPSDLTKQEADRLCAMLQTLVMPLPEKGKP